MTRQITGRRRTSALLGACAALLAVALPARAAVTVAGWPGGPEEIALRKVTDIYNAQPAAPMRTA